MSDLVNPRLFRGLRDLLPEQMAARERIVATIRDIFELYGFMPLGTPAIEYLDVLYGSAAGEEAQRSVFRVENPDDEPLGLRFDLTVPLARVVAQYRELPRPFRRYQVASVFRADKPDPGRYREFTQFDIDSVGVASEWADVEIIAAACDVLAALNVGAYRVRFSSRQVLNLLLKYAGVTGPLAPVAPPGSKRPLSDPSPRDATDVFRVLDKLPKVGPERVRLELTTGYVDASGDAIPGLNLSVDSVRRIEEFLAIPAADRAETLAKLRTLFAAVPDAVPTIDVLNRMSQRLDQIGYGNDRALVDLSIARGLSYYTGPVFEASLADAPQFGAIFGGGRYDNLVQRFLGEHIPATGASIGVDRLLAALLELGRVTLRRATAQVLVTTLDAALADDYWTMTQELRREGIRTELYLGSERVGKQVKYADALGVPLVLMYGSNEKQKGVVTIKDMEAGRQRAEQIAGREAWLRERPGQVEAPRSELVATVKSMLGIG
ncbi:MAG: histidine--tRNA ligase [Phycisphaerae bacterium]|nr:histidine--tRNA ligase [Phycisphaerae bacterium]NUQ46300.1 histidine--tRNA ligase [Phycisphaerae bacterium]